VSGGQEPAFDPESVPQLLSFAVHELRSPLSVVAGYIRMVLSERVGPLAPQQRDLLEKAEKSCGRLSEVLKEASDLSKLQDGTATFNRRAVDLRALLQDVVSSLPPLEREVTVVLQADEAAQVHGDATRLKAAMSSILVALRRELVSGNRLVVRLARVRDEATASLRITVGEPDRIEGLQALPETALTEFDYRRGSTGLTLAQARRVLEAHGGRLSEPIQDGKKAVAIVSIPAI
jgi:signal transduction histidine kinase